MLQNNIHGKHFMIDTLAEEGLHNKWVNFLSFSFSQLLRNLFNDCVSTKHMGKFPHNMSQ